MATIYKILSPCLQECYIGSTIRKVEWRWTQHRHKNNATNSKILFEKYGIDNCKFMIVEKCSIEERFIKEQWWLDNSIGIVNENNVIPSIENTKILTKEWKELNKEKMKQYHKIYREKNKEKLKQYQKEWGQTNKEKIKQTKKLYREAKKSLIQ